MLDPKIRQAFTSILDSAMQIQAIGLRAEDTARFNGIDPRRNTLMEIDPNLALLAQNHLKVLGDFRVRMETDRDFVQLGLRSRANAYSQHRQTWQAMDAIANFTNPRDGTSEALEKIGFAPSTLTTKSIASFNIGNEREMRGIANLVISNRPLCEAMLGAQGLPKKYHEKLFTYNANYARQSGIPAYILARATEDLFAQNRRQKSLRDLPTLLRLKTIDAARRVLDVPARAWDMIKENLGINQTKWIAIKSDIAKDAAAAAAHPRFAETIAKTNETPETLLKIYADRTDAAATGILNNNTRRTMPQPITEDMQKALMFATFDGQNRLVNFDSLMMKDLKGSLWSLPQALQNAGLINSTTEKMPMLTQKGLELRNTLLATSDVETARVKAADIQTQNAHARHQPTTPITAQDTGPSQALSLLTNRLDQNTPENSWRDHLRQSFTALEFARELIQHNLPEDALRQGLKRTNLILKDSATFLLNDPEFRATMLGEANLETKAMSAEQRDAFDRQNRFANPLWAQIINAKEGEAIQLHSTANGSLSVSSIAGHLAETQAFAGFTAIANPLIAAVLLNGASDNADRYAAEQLLEKHLPHAAANYLLTFDGAMEDRALYQRQARETAAMGNTSEAERFLDDATNSQKQAMEIAGVITALPPIARTACENAFHHDETTGLVMKSASGKNLEEIARTADEVASYSAQFRQTRDNISAALLQSGETGKTIAEAEAKELARNYLFRESIMGTSAQSSTKDEKNEAAAPSLQAFPQDQFTAAGPQKSVPPMSETVKTIAHALLTVHAAA